MKKGAAIIVPLAPLWFQCSCKHREFAIQGFSQGNALKLFRVTCARRGCNKVYDIDRKGELGGYLNQGKLTHIIHKGQEIENG